MAMEPARANHSIVSLYLKWHQDSENGIYMAEGSHSTWRIKKILSRFFLQRKIEGEDWAPVDMYSRVRDAKNEAELIERKLLLNRLD